jgi:hypothetical protein
MNQPKISDALKAVLRADWYQIIIDGRLGHVLKLAAIVMLWDGPRMALIWILTEIRLILAKLGTVIIVAGRLITHFANVVIPRWQQKIASASWKARD